MVNVKIFNSLSTVDWDTAIHTYGNDHSTLIGLLVQWWIKLSPNDNFALDGCPTCGKNDKEEPGVYGDALLCTGTSASGILEVEGTKTVDTIKKIGRFFGSKKEELKTLDFAILLLYDYWLEGRGIERDYIEHTKIAKESVVKNLSKISAQHTGKTIILITLEKRYERQHRNVRSLSEFYFGTPDFIEGSLYFNGECIKRKDFYQSQLYIRRRSIYKSKKMMG